MRQVLSRADAERQAIAFSLGIFAGELSPLSAAMEAADEQS